MGPTAYGDSQPQGVYPNEETYKYLCQLIGGYALRFSNGQDTEDFISDTLTYKVLPNWHKIDGKPKAVITVYVRAAALSVGINTNQWKKKQPLLLRDKSAILETLPNAGRARDAVDRVEARDTLKNALQELTMLERRVLLLRRKTGLTFDAIADRIGNSTPYTWRVYKRAEKKIKSFLKQ